MGRKKIEKSKEPVVKETNGKVTPEEVDKTFEDAKKMFQGVSTVEFKPDNPELVHVEIEEPNVTVLGAQLEKFIGFRADLAVIETLAEMKFIESKAAAAAEFARRNKLGLDEQNEWGKFRLEIEGKKGEWLDKNFPAGGDKKARLKGATLKSEGITKSESASARLVSNHPDLVKKVMSDIENAGKVITPNAVTVGIKKIKNAEKTPVKKESSTKGVTKVNVDGLYKIQKKDSWDLIKSARKEIAKLEKKLVSATKDVDDYSEATKSEISADKDNFKIMSKRDKLQKIENDIINKMGFIKIGLGEDLIDLIEVEIVEEVETPENNVEVKTPEPVEV